MSEAKPVITIEYCRQCRWLLRAAWMQQELLIVRDAIAPEKSLGHSDRKP